MTDVIWPDPPCYRHDVAKADEGNGDVSKLAEVPAAKRKGVKRPQPKLDPQRCEQFQDLCMRKMS